MKLKDFPFHLRSWLYLMWWRWVGLPSPAKTNTKADGRNYAR